MTAGTGGAAVPQPLSSGLRVAPVDGRADLDRFIRLPARLYSGWKGFVAPLVTRISSNAHGETRMRSWWERPGVKE